MYEYERTKPGGVAKKKSKSCDINKVIKQADFYGQTFSLTFQGQR